MVVQHCTVHSTQSVNTAGALAANKSARAMLGPPDTALLHVCGPPHPGVANRPSSGACCVGLGLVGYGQWGARCRGSRGQRRVTYQRTRLIKPWPALAMVRQQYSRCNEGPNCRTLLFPKGMADGSGPVMCGKWLTLQPAPVWNLCRQIRNILEPHPFDVLHSPPFPTRTTL